MASALTTDPEGVLRPHDCATGACSVEVGFSVSEAFLATLEAQLLAAVHQAETLVAERNALQDEVADLQAQVEDFEFENNDLQGQIDDLELEVDDLRDQLGID